MNKEKPKQEAPIPFRPYPPVRKYIKDLDPNNLNWFLNVAVGSHCGLTEDELARYKREKWIDP